jgi:hypothetical protein
MSMHYDNLDQIAAVVQGFESCTTPKENFGHPLHLTVALWYLHNNTFEQAAAKMRAGLFRFIKYHDVPSEKYNETITLFWLKLVKAFLIAETSPGELDSAYISDAQLVVLTNQLLQTFQDSNLVFQYYSREAISSPAAKTGWLESDLKEFDF